MLKNRGGRKSGLIYSILTIIVLTSISGECATQEQIKTGRCAARGRLEAGQHAQDAAVLITADLFFVRFGYSPMEDGDLTEGSCSHIMDISIDGASIENWKRMGRSDEWVELSPGRHKIVYTIDAYVYNINKKTLSSFGPRWESVELDVIASAIYCVEDIHTSKKRGKRSGMYKNDSIDTESPAEGAKIKKTTRLRDGEWYTYDQTTGIATHPTDSKLSFKVK